MATTRAHRPDARRGFTLPDLIVSVALVVLMGLPVGVAEVGRLRGQNHRVRCASNLRQIGLAIQMYANENKGNFPRAVWDRETADAPTEYTGVSAAHPFGPGGPAANDVTAGLFLLLRTQQIGPEVFVCPAVADASPWDFGGLRPQSVSNFPGPAHLSYSYVNTYRSHRTRERFCKLGMVYVNLAVVADMNPGSAELVAPPGPFSGPVAAAVNSRNHGGRGQNVLYNDGRVVWSETPYCGPARPPSAFPDNIFTYGPADGAGAGEGIRGASRNDDFDCVLLPTALDGPRVMPSTASVVRRVAPRARWPLVAIAGAVLLPAARAAWRVRHPAGATRPPYARPATAGSRSS